MDPDLGPTNYRKFKLIWVWVMTLYCPAPQPGYTNLYNMLNNLFILYVQIINLFSYLIMILNLKLLNIITIPSFIQFFSKILDHFCLAKYYDSYYFMNHF